MRGLEEPRGRESCSESAGRSRGLTGRRTAQTPAHPRSHKGAEDSQVTRLTKGLCPHTQRHAQNQTQRERAGRRTVGALPEDMGDMGPASTQGRAPRAPPQSEKRRLKRAPLRTWGGGSPQTRDKHWCLVPVRTQTARILGSFF